MSQAISPGEILSQVSAELRRLQRQRDQLLRDLEHLRCPPSGMRGAPKDAPSHKDLEAQAQQAIEEVDVRITQLKQIEETLRNPEMIQIMGNILDDRIHRAERRQQIISFLQNFIFLIAGWLLSLLASPAGIFSTIFH